MKKLFYILLPLFIVSIFIQSCSSGDAGNATPEDLGRTILYALKENDKTLYHNYLYSENEVDYLVANGKRMPYDKNQQMQSFNEYKPNRLESFDKILKKASAKGLTDWSSAKFSKITYKTFEDGIQLNKVRLEFTTDEHVGQINLWALNKSDNGWFISAVPEFISYHRIPNF